MSLASCVFWGNPRLCRENVNLRRASDEHLGPCYEGSRSGAKPRGRRLLDRISLLSPQVFPLYAFHFSLAPAQCLPRPLPICDPSSMHPREHHLGWPCSSATCPRSARRGELCYSNPCLCPDTFSLAGFAAGNSLISSPLLSPSGLCLTHPIWALSWPPPP